MESDAATKSACEREQRISRMVDFLGFDEWIENRVHPVVFRAVLTVLVLFICFTIIDFLRDGQAPGFVRSIALRAAALTALLLMAAVQSVPFFRRQRTLLTLLFGLVCQAVMEYVYIFMMGRLAYVPFMVLYYFIIVLLLAPALDFKLFLASAGIMVLQLGTFMHFSNKKADDYLYIGLAVLMVFAFLGYVVWSQGSSARELWRLAREYYTRSTIDALSRLLNRRSWYERSSAVINERRAAGSESAPVSFIMLDIDHFKQINDRWGHECGDLVIREVSMAVLDETREGDMIGRLGGEEFGILLPGAREDVSCDVAERIRHRIAGLDLEYRGHRVGVTVSLGLVGDVSGDLDAIVRAGDERLYAAKRSGRNKVVRFACPGSHESSSTTLSS